MAFYNKAKKYVRKVGKKTYAKAKKRYTSKRGTFKIGKLVRDVNMIKRTINPEKKQAEMQINGQGVGQSNGSFDGVFVSTIIPTIAQGNGFGNRDGRSIKTSGSYIRGQFVQQSSTVNKLKFNVTIVMSKGIPQTVQQIVEGTFNSDTISGLRDYFSPRNPDSFTDYRIICSRNYTLYPDSITGQTGRLDYMIPLKLGHHIRYNLNTTTIEEGNMYIIIRADSGDSAANTGAFFSMSHRLTYYDN